MKRRLTNELISKIEKILEKTDFTLFDYGSVYLIITSKKCTIKFKTTNGVYSTMDGYIDNESHKIIAKIIKVLEWDKV